MLYNTYSVFSCRYVAYVVDCEGLYMDSRTNVEVLILGKVYTLSGYESEEYLQKIASYINNKMAEYNKIDSFKKLSMDYQSVLMQVNLADDYFKAKKQVDVLEEEIKAKEKELYDLKHELIARKPKHDKPIIFVTLIKCLKLFILWRKSTFACCIHN